MATKEKIVKTPLEHGVLTLEELLDMKALDYKDTSFINQQKIKYDESLKIK